LKIRNKVRRILIVLIVGNDGIAVVQICQYHVRLI